LAIFVKGENAISMTRYNLITVLGPTAVGKTRFAAHLAAEIGGEVISADSRQVYRGMDIGTGKDYDDYLVEGKMIPVHLVDIVDPGYEYNVYEFQKDFIRIYNELTGRKKIPVLCGGSGLYLESVLKGYRLISVPVNIERHQQLERMSDQQLTEILASLKNLHNISDTGNRKRLIRAVEISEYYSSHPEDSYTFPVLSSLIIGLRASRDFIRSGITARLKKRLEQGMVDEARRLADNGLTLEKMSWYGLEYKYLALYLKGSMSRQDMFTKLNTAIHRYSKRQMTWYRKMEREGFVINWLDASAPLEQNLETARGWLNK
jgi:tRNA dimethylallyltransferase